MEEEINVNNCENNIEENVNADNNTNVNNTNVNNNNVNNGNAELPMNWWKFLKYFRYPFGILGLFVSVVQGIKGNVIAMGWLGWTAMILDTVTLITSSVAYAMMLGKHKKWFNFFVLNLIVESVRMTFVLVLKTLNMSLESEYIYFNDYNEIVIFALMRLVLVSCIWIIPNYIYFKKRKAYFTKKEENITI